MKTNTIIINGTRMVLMLEVLKCVCFYKVVSSNNIH